MLLALTLVLEQLQLHLYKNNISKFVYANNDIEHYSSILIDFIAIKKRRLLAMLNNKEKNSSIQCTVDDCKYHASSADYCTLSSIRVSKTGDNPRNSHDTECDSFIAKTDKFF